MALLGSRGLNLTTTSSSRPQARLRCQPQQQLLLKPGSSVRQSRRGICRQAAASDQKNASEPMYLSDLIMFEVRCCLVQLGYVLHRTLLYAAASAHARLLCAAAAVLL
jgi:hypothetical protein